MSLAGPVLRRAHIINGLIAGIPAENVGDFIPSDGHADRLLVDERNQSNLPEEAELAVQHRINFDQEAIVVGRRHVRRQLLRSKLVGVQINRLLRGDVNSNFIVCLSLYLHSGGAETEMEIRENFLFPAICCFRYLCATADFGFNDVTSREWGKGRKTFDVI